MLESRDLFRFDCRRSHHWVNSGLPQLNRTYLPSRAWGIGSEQRLRLCSLTQLGGTRHRWASSSAVRTSKNGPSEDLFCAPSCAPAVFIGSLSKSYGVRRFVEPLYLSNRSTTEPHRRLVSTVSQSRPTGTSLASVVCPVPLTPRVNGISAGVVKLHAILLLLHRMLTQRIVLRIWDSTAS